MRRACTCASHICRSSVRAGLSICASLSLADNRSTDLRASAGWLYSRAAAREDLRIGVDPSDKRLVEFSVYGLPLYRGVPLLCDSTQGSPLHVDGKPHPHTCTEDGATCSRLEKPKNSTYAEVVQSSGYKLVTLACEVGGRWSDTCLQVVSELAVFKASKEPAHLQKAVEFAYLSRWWSLLSVTAQTAFAESLVTCDPLSIQPTFAYEPQTSMVVLDCRFDIGPAFSRLPARG